jgi:hypothetical protein
MQITLTRCVHAGSRQALYPTRGGHLGMFAQALPQKRRGGPVSIPGTSPGEGGPMPMSGASLGVLSGLITQDLG